MWYSNISCKDLQDLSLHGKVTNRIISWRLMLKVLSGSHDDMISQSWSHRSHYYSLKSDLEPKSSAELDPNVFNPLSQHSQVIFNQRTRGLLISRTKKCGKQSVWTWIAPSRN